MLATDTKHHHLSMWSPVPVQLMVDNLHPLRVALFCSPPPSEGSCKMLQHVHPLQLTVWAEQVCVIDLPSWSNTLKHNSKIASNELKDIEVFSSWSEQSDDRCHIYTYQMRSEPLLKWKILIVALCWECMFFEAYFWIASYKQICPELTQFLGCGTNPLVLCDYVIQS